jgi:hypothetical protein
MYTTFFDERSGRAERQSPCVKDMGEYDDIINLPHYEPKNHPRMSMWKRAAQFAPFAALKGYEEAIKEAERKNEESYEPQYDDSEIGI